MNLEIVVTFFCLKVVKAEATEAGEATNRFGNRPTTTTVKKDATTTKNSTTTTTKKSATTTKKATTTKASTAEASSAAPSNIPSPTTTSVIPSLVPAGTSTVGTSSSAISPSATALSDTASGGGVSGGAIGGIVAAIVIIILGAIAYFIVRRKKNNKDRSRHISTKPDPFTMGYGSDQAFHAQQQPMQQQQTYQHQYGVQPTVAVTSPTSPTYYNNNTQFQDANSHIIAESMKPAVVPQSQQYQSQEYQPQEYQPQEYQPQLNEQYNNEHIDPPAPIAAVVAAPIVTTGSTLLSPTQAGSVGVFHVAATYTPTLSDEIDIQTGDQVEVLVEYDDGWCQGINLSRGNAKGVFPKHCIDYASGVSSSGNSTDRAKRVSSMYIA